MAILVTVVPLFVVGLMLIDINARSLEDRIREFQVAVADDIARTLQTQLSQTRETLVAVQRIFTDDRIDDGARVAVAESLVEAAEGVDHVSIFDAEGRLIDTIRQDTAPDGVSLEVPADLRRRLETEAYVIGTPTFGGLTRVPVFLALKVDGRTTGYLGSDTSLATVQARVSRLGAAHFSDGASPLIVIDDAGRLLAAAASPKPPGTVIDLPLVAQLTDASRAAGIAVSLEYSGDEEPMTGAAVPIPGLPWAVLVQQPQRVVYGTLSQMRKVIIATIIAAVIIALLVALFIARRITAPVAHLARFAADLSARRFDKRIEVHTADELAVLAHAMSNAAAHLESSEARIKEEVAIRADLGRYLPGELVDKVVAREQDMGLGGRRSEITVLFADVVGFTPLTEKLEPETVVALLNELFTLLTEIVFRYEGTVDKFVGDCVMAVWGAPREVPDHATRALEAAEEMLRFVELSSVGWRDRFGVQVELAIGVNTGPAVVGNIGSETRMEYTAIGDVVNVAAHLESIARPMQVLVTDAVRVAAGDGFEFAGVGERTVPGRKAPLTLFEVR